MYFDRHQKNCLFHYDYFLMNCYHKLNKLEFNVEDNDECTMLYIQCTSVSQLVNDNKPEVASSWTTHISMDFHCWSSICDHMWSYFESFWFTSLLERLPGIFIICTIKIQLVCTTMEGKPFSGYILKTFCLDPMSYSQLRHNRVVDCQTRCILLINGLILCETLTNSSKWWTFIIDMIIILIL